MRNNRHIPKNRWPEDEADHRHVNTTRRRRKVPWWTLLWLIPAIAVLIGMVFPVGPSPHGCHYPPRCSNNLMQLYTATMQYCLDHKGHFPPAGTWYDDLYPEYVIERGVLVCPRTEGRIPSYAMNVRLRNHKRSDLGSSDHVVLFFDCVPGKNRVGGPELFPKTPRHGDKHIVLFLDGTVEAVQPSKVWELNWGPSPPAP